MSGKRGPDMFTGHGGRGGSGRIPARSFEGPRQEALEMAWVLLIALILAGPIGLALVVAGVLLGTLPWMLLVPPTGATLILGIVAYVARSKED